MYKQFFENETKEALKKAYPEITTFNLHLEKPKNPYFGDFAINVSPLARDLKTAPPVIAQNIEKQLAFSKNYHEIKTFFSNLYSIYSILLFLLLSTIMLYTLSRNSCFCSCTVNSLTG